METIASMWVWKSKSRGGWKSVSTWNRGDLSIGVSWGWGGWKWPSLSVPWLCANLAQSLGFNDVVWSHNIKPIRIAVLNGERPSIFISKTLLNYTSIKSSYRCAITAYFIGNVQQFGVESLQKTFVFHFRHSSTTIWRRFHATIRSRKRGALFTLGQPQSERIHLENYF